MRRTASIAVVLMGVGPIVWADEPFKASNGTVLPAPEIAGLDCDEIDTLMTRYSASAYRAFEELPESHPDYAIFAYEDRLAQTFYDRCQIGQGQFQDVSNAFSKGFK